MSSASDRRLALVVSTHYFWEEPLAEEHFSVFAEAGFEAVELFFTPRHLDHRSPARAREIREMVEKHRLRIVSGHAPYMPDVKANLASPVRGEREEAVEGVFEAIRFLKEVGANYLVLHPGSSHYSPERRDEHMLAAAESIRRIVAFAAKCGIDVALENPPPVEFAGEPEVFSELLRKLEGLPLKFCYDIGHAAIAGMSLSDFTSLTGGRVIAAHLSDNDGRADLHLPPGEGAIDWGKFFEDLSGVQDGFFLTVEIESRTCPPACLRRVRAWLEERL